MTDPSQLLAAYREGHSGSAAQRELAFQTVTRRIEAGDPGLTLAAGPGGRVMSRSTALFLLGSIVALAGVGVGFGLSEWSSSSDAAESADEERSEVVGVRSDVVERGSEPAVIEPAPAELPRVEAPRTVPAPADATEASPTRKSKQKVAPGPEIQPASASTLREELRILAAGRKSLREGDAEQALVRFAEHRRRFPTGQLAEEREINRHEALCSLDRGDEAATLRSEFKRDHPDSPHAAKLRQGCGVEP